MYLTSYAALTGLKLGLVEPGWTFVFQIANTLILFLILKKLLFKPVTEFMQKRQETIAGSLEEARKKNLDAQALSDQYQEKLAQAREEGQGIVKAMEQEAEMTALQIKKEAQAEARKIKDDALREIEREKVKAIQALKDEVAEMVVLAASQVVEKDFSADEHRAFIEKFIGEVGDTKWQN
jgi:F-type H+-transporting ATPase subunit b